MLHTIIAQLGREFRKLHRIGRGVGGLRVPGHDTDGAEACGAEAQRSQIWRTK